MAQLDKKKIIGLLLFLCAMAVVAAGWAWAHSSGETSTDNAYIRGDATSLAPKVSGYVTTVEVTDNQTVRAGDVLFRIEIARCAVTVGWRWVDEADPAYKAKNHLRRQSECHMMRVI